MKKGRIVVAISGRGNLLQRILLRQDKFGYEVGGVISSNPNAAGLIFAHKAELPVLVLDFTQYGIAAQLVSWLRELEAEALILAGFTRHFPSISGYEERTISVHPSLLPKFGGKGMFGMHVHRAVFAAQDKKTGVTAHQVSYGFDEGRYLAQIEVDVSDCQSPEEVQARVDKANHWLFPRLIGILVENNWRKIPLLLYQQEGDGYSRCV